MADGRKKEMNKPLILLGLGVMASVGAWAAPTVCANFGTNLSAGQSYADPNSGDVCTLDGVSFSDFTIYANSGFPSSPGTAVASLTVTEIDANELEFGTQNLTSEDLTIYFQAKPGNVTSVTLTGSAGESVTESVCSVAIAIGSENCSPADQLNTSTLSVTGNGSATSAVTTASTQYFVKDDSGGSSLTQSYLFVNTVPEPMSFSLVGAGLLGFGFARRRMRQ